MDLFGFGLVIIYFVIISHSYHLICKGQINRKELYVFGAYTLLVEVVLELPFYFLSLNGLGIVTFLFPLGLYSYFRWIKQYERDRGLFLSLLLSLFRCNGVDLFCCLKNHSLFPFGTRLF